MFFSVVQLDFLSRVPHDEVVCGHDLAVRLAELDLMGTHVEMMSRGDSNALWVLKYLAVEAPKVEADKYDPLVAF